MHDKSARVFSGLGVLVLVWIVVYWSWPVRDDGVSLPDLGLEGPALEDEPITQSPVGVERFPSPPIRPVETPPETIPAPENPVVEESAEAPDTPSVIAPQFDDYVVVSGDNFERISQKVFGSRRHAMAIARSNPLLDPRKLRAGATIRVPRDPTNIQGVETGGAGEGTSPSRPGSAGTNATIEYTVKSGDTLSGISKAFYGSASPTYIDFLYNANRGRMASRNDLRLGQVLLIPPFPEGAD